MKCKINSCTNDVHSRGLCNKHYVCWRTHGNPNFTKCHGYSYHTLYNVWNNMKQRCYNKNNSYYQNYGGRGITVCDEWKNSAKVFIDWALDNGWKKGLGLDRRNNNGNYHPDNCRFITHIENNHNVRLLQKNNTSGYRGVHYFDKKWRADIVSNSKKKYLGRFDSPRIAALRYDVEAYLLNDGRPRNFL